MDWIGLDWVGSPGGRGYRAPYGANNYRAATLLTGGQKCTRSEKLLDELAGEPSEFVSSVKVRNLD